MIKLTTYPRQCEVSIKLVVGEAVHNEYTERQALIAFPLNVMNETYFLSKQRKLPDSPSLIPCLLQLLSLGESV